MNELQHANPRLYPKRKHFVKLNLKGWYEKRSARAVCVQWAKVNEKLGANLSVSPVIAVWRFFHFILKCFELDFKKSHYQY